MGAALQRDQACLLATTNPGKALDKARKIAEPWYRAQALAWVARFAENNAVAIAREAARAAMECDDDYKQSAVRAWEIAALAERGFTVEARKSLSEATTLAKKSSPIPPAVKRSICCFRLRSPSVKRTQPRCMS